MHSKTRRLVRIHHIIQCNINDPPGGRQWRADDGGLKPGAPPWMERGKGKGDSKVSQGSLLLNFPFILSLLSSSYPEPPASHTARKPCRSRLAHLIPRGASSFNATMADPTPEKHVNVLDEQTVISDVGNYADINDLKALLDSDLAPYFEAGVWYHRYRIEVSAQYLWYDVVMVAVQSWKGRRLTFDLFLRQTDQSSGDHRVWAPREVTEVSTLELWIFLLFCFLLPGSFS